MKVINYYSLFKLSLMEIWSKVYFKPQKQNNMDEKTFSLFCSLICIINVMHSK